MNLDIEERKEFVFKESWWKAIENLPRGIQGEVLTAIVRYGLYGETTENLKPIAKAIIELVSAQINDEKSKPKRGCPKGVANNANGRRGNKKTNSELNEELNKTNSELISSDLVLKDKEKRKEKEKFPPDPLSKEKENKKEKETTPKPPEGASAVAVARKEIISEIFSKEISLEGFCKANSTTSEELQRLAEEVFDEWELVNETDLSVRHLMNTLRIKLRQQSNYANNRKYSDSNWSGNNGKQFRGAVDFDCGLIED